MDRGNEASSPIGFKTTSTIMYGHVETSEHWANHLLAIRDLQIETGGFTELYRYLLLPRKLYLPQG